MCQHKRPLLRLQWQLTKQLLLQKLRKRQLQRRLPMQLLLPKKLRLMRLLPRLTALLLQCQRLMLQPLIQLL